MDVKTTFIGYDVFFDDLYPENITIGKMVRITQGARILSHFIDTKMVLSDEKPFRFYTGNVIIEDFVFIGMNVVITKPVTIGKGAIIGANSVISENILPFEIVGGVPAKRISIRKTK